MSDSQDQVAEKISSGRTSLGIEFGSTRIKAVLIDDERNTIATGDYGWQSHLVDGLWSYDVDKIWRGLQSVYADVADCVEAQYGQKLVRIGQIGFSAMMHGYLAFNEDGELLVPFRTWQNTNTSEAHERLSQLFQYNIPERWSIAHLYQAVLNDEPHIGSVRYFTTLAGYVHWKLTGRKVLGVGDASGMFPIDPETKTYERAFIEQFDALPEVAAQPWKLEDLLPEPLVAGTPAGTLTPEGAALLDPSGVLQPGVALAPARRRCGHRHGGHELRAPPHRQCLRRHIDLRHRGARAQAVHAAPGSRSGHHPGRRSGRHEPRQQLHLGSERVDQPVPRILPAQRRFGQRRRPVRRAVPQRDQRAGGPGRRRHARLPVPHRRIPGRARRGRPLFVREPEARFNLANFMRAQLFGAFSPVTIGMNVMTHDEGVQIDSLVGHGGIFATPVVAQRILAAAFDTPIRVMTTASEGGAWGMAVLAGYLRHADTPLADYLDEVVFANAQSVTEDPQPADVEGFRMFFARFMQALPVERTAVECMPIGGE